MAKILIVCGPTATGKTGFALDLCRRIPAEVISADSRQVYREMSIVTGKDIPAESVCVNSAISWHGQKLVYYRTGKTKIWLYDVVSPDQPFSVSHWHQTANLVIKDILRRHRLPVIVGGTGLYIKSLTSPFSGITIPPNYSLRQQLSQETPVKLFHLLSRVDPSRAASLNSSDRANSRRLIRAIEIGLSASAPATPSLPESDLLIIGLRADREYLNSLISDRVASRLKLGARQEAETLLSRYGSDLPSMTASGYRTFLFPDWETKWITAERQYLKRQLTWFNKQPGIKWFDITDSNWRLAAQKYFLDWYNDSDVKKS